MDETPFVFAWPVDEHGYAICRNRVDPEIAQRGKDELELIVRRGGPLRYYWPLDDEGLWLRFAQTCKDAESVLAFTNEFGRLGESPKGLDDRLDHILETAALIRRIAAYLEAGERLNAVKLFDGNAPTMKVVIMWYADAPESLQYRLLPLTLRDALLHQAGEAITGNRRFRRCRNQECPNWFRLGPHTPSEGRRRTYTTRREFCSDRCRVAWARRQKRGSDAHA